MIEINIRNIPNKFIRFKIYKNILHFFKFYRLNILIKYYDKEFLICNELDLKNVFMKLDVYWIYDLFILQKTCLRVNISSKLFNPT